MGNMCISRDGKVGFTGDPLLDRAFRNASGVEPYLIGDADKTVHLMSYNLLSDGACLPAIHSHGTEEMLKW